MRIAAHALRIAAIASALFAATAPACAATCGTVLNPILLGATGVAFGLYSPGAALGAKSNGTVTVACTIALASTLPSFTVALSAGTGGFAPRRMGFGAAWLNYNLYTAATDATVWGDGTGVTTTQSYAASEDLAAAPFTVYGLAAPGQFVTPGLYSDSITMTVTF